jgi:anti-anti-sigma regulatory factor
VSIRITEVESRTENSDLKGGAPHYQNHPSETLTPSPRKPRILKVEGTLHLKDAELLEKICRETSEQTGRPVIVELNDVCFVDSDSAAVICRMKREKVITIEGLNLFIKKVMELVDESECSSGANCS